MLTEFLAAEREKPKARVFAFAFFLGYIALVALPQVQAAAKLSSLTGNVYFRPSGTKDWNLIKQSRELASGDQLRTEARSRATVTFDDGSRIEIGPNGNFAVQESSPQRNSVVMSLGSMRAWVTKGLSRQFRVRTPTAVCSVRGTEFGVEVTPAGTSVQMFEGVLAVADNAGNEVLIKEGQSIKVDDKGMGPVGGGESSANKSREAAKREVGLEMSKEEVQAAAALEQKNAIYQQGKAIIDVNGNRVRIEEYIIRPQADVFKLVVLNERASRFDYFYYRGTFNKDLPSDISIALRQLPGCIDAACEYFLKSYETARSNTIDNMTETASGGHLVDVNNNGVAADKITEAYDPLTDKFISLSVPNPGGVGNQAFFKTLYNTNTLKFNNVTHSGWTSALAGGADIGNMKSAASGGHVNFNFVTSVKRSPVCSPPDCTFKEGGVFHDVIYASNADGSIWEKYESYIISDEGHIAKDSDFAGITSGAQYKSTLLNWNFQIIVTASEFQGRKIDLAVEPKIFIQSGLIQ